MSPPIDISDMMALIQCSFTELDFLAPEEGPWDWRHPVLHQWMQANGFPTLRELLDNPAATYVVLQSLRAKIQKCQAQSEQLPLPLVITPQWGAWIDPSAGVKHG